MNEEQYKVRSLIKEYVENRINENLESFRSSYNDYRYLFLYPLIDIELQLINDEPESISNFVRRNTFGFLIEKFLPVITATKTTFDIEERQLHNYSKEAYEIIKRIAQDYRTYLEICDGSSYAKSDLDKVSEGKYKLTTSLVTNKYNESAFYFYGFDDPKQAKKEREMIIEGIDKFNNKYLSDKKFISKIKRLPIDVDMELLEYSKNMVLKDINKLGPKVKSRIIKSLDELANVLSFLYYLSFIHRHMAMIYISQRDYMNLLLCYEKEWLINKISKLYAMDSSYIKKAIDYLINDGTQQILSFPLFEFDGYIITAPSFIMVNDWQFTLVNGHYYKGIQFINKHKNISLTTQNKLIERLSSISNVVYSSGKMYSFIDADGVEKNGEIDLAILDIECNKALIIECKWKENHYYNEIDERHIKIQDTLNKIFGKQISKHREFLSDRSNIEYIFDNDKRVVDQETTPELYFLAVDKRNQLHLSDNHMITEFMFLYFINKYTQDNVLSLELMIKEIFSLLTKVEYISSTSDCNEFVINDHLTLVAEEVELKLENSV